MSSVPPSTGAPERLLRRRYRSRVARLARLQSVTAGCFVILSHAGVAATVAVAHASLYGIVQVVLYPFVVVLIASRMRALGNIVHECAHGTFVRGAGANRFLGQVLAAIDLTSFRDYCRVHATHHAHLGDPELDLDLRRNYGALAVTDRAFWSLHLVAGIAHVFRPWRHGMVLWRDGDGCRVNALRISVYVCALWLVAFDATRSAALAYWILPLLTAYRIVQYWSDAADHGGLLGASESFGRTRNHVLRWRWLNLLIHPRNDAYHLVHHLFPEFPVETYPAAHDLLLEDPLYAERRHVI